MVSVVIPVYNRIEQTCAAIRSVLTQNYQNIQLIVVDDGSTVEMAEVCELVRNNAGLYLQAEHRGVSAARNLGVAHASGRWLAFLDSDDLWLDDKLKLQRSFLDQNPQFRICQTEERWYRNGKFVNPCKHHRKPDGEAFFRSLELCCISPSAVMLDRELFLDSGGFDERMPVCEDYDLWLRLSRQHQVGLLKEPLMHKFGGHEDQLSRSQLAMDRFRVYSLVKLIYREDLSRDQHRAVLEQVERKCVILLQGAKKRKNDHASTLYSEILSRTEHAKAAEQSTVSKVFHDVLEGLLSDISGECSY